MRTVLVSLAVVVTVVVAASALGLGSPASGPALPTVVSMSAEFEITTSTMNIYRQWSDGRFDKVVFQEATNCGDSPAPNCVVQLLPGTTTFADVDRDGVVGIIDFLAVLSNWDEGP